MEQLLLNPSILFGLHSKKVGNFTKTLDWYRNYPLNAIQIFGQSPKSFKSSKLNNQDILNARKIIKQRKIILIIHAALVYNLCGSVKGKTDPKFESMLTRVCKSLTYELDVSTGLDNVGVVVHVGSSKDKKRGARIIAKTIEHCLTVITPELKILAKGLNENPKSLVTKRKIILENCAGEGNKIGASLDEMAEIINLLPENLRSQVSVCIDTQHCFGSGEYDFGLVGDVERFIKEFDEKLGLDKLTVFHLNDSNVKFGSKKDRHRGLGNGYIFNTIARLKGLERLVQFAQERKIPMICEMPDGDGIGEDEACGVTSFKIMNMVCNLVY